MKKELPRRSNPSLRHCKVCFLSVAACGAIATVIIPSGLGDTNEPPAANAVAIPQPAKCFLADAGAGCLPKPDRLLDRAWATPEAGELLQRLRREYPADQEQIDVYLACWNYFNGDPYEAKEKLRRLSRKVESVQLLYVRLLARDGDWREVKKVAATTDYAVSARAEAYLKLRNRALRAGRKDDAAIYAKERERLLRPEAQSVGAAEKETSEEEVIEK